MAIPDDERCCKRVSDHIGFNFFQCERRGKIEHDGKFYCWQHDPVAVKSREKASQDKFEAEWAAQRKGWSRTTAEKQACEGISTDSLTPGLVRELVATLGLFEKWRELLKEPGSGGFAVSISREQLKFNLNQLDSIRFEE